jgi:hypothetical protein
MAVRASQQRSTRLAAAGHGLAAAGEVAALPSVAAVAAMAAGPPRGGDDDSDDELDSNGEDFYAGAFEVLP